MPRRNIKQPGQLSREDWVDLFLKQKGLCPICGEPGITDQDHDHETGKIRGLLCHSCNIWLGKADIDASGIKEENARRYLGRNDLK